MSIPKNIKIKHHRLPSTSGVYLFKDKKGKVVYVGKATNLRSRVGAYWRYSEDRPPRSRRTVLVGRLIDDMLHEVHRIDWVTTDSVIEALILEANLIRKYMPRYNVREKDDKSFLYVIITREQWPKVQLMRGSELRDIRYSKLGIRNRKYPISNIQYQKIFGPYTSASSIRAALDLIRKWFPWSTCKAWQRRPCFDYHIGRCPGVCIGAVTHKEYMKNIRNVVLMLEGKKAQVIKNVKLKMQNEAKRENFEEAEKLRRKLFALEHIRDVAVLGTDYRLQSIDYSPHVINVLGRIEGYDISNISGTSAVGSMVVFQDGETRKNEYRRFRVKTVKGINDVAMMREVLHRRFSHDDWARPDLIVIDGGWGQVNAAQEVVADIRRTVLRSGRRTVLRDIPIVGIAKGFKRKQDRPIFEKDNLELTRIVENYNDLLLRVRDEAHRFAVAYHRKRMRKRLR